MEAAPTDEDDMGPPILRRDVEVAIQAMKCKEAVGIDEIPAEVLKSLDERGIDEIWKLCKLMYDTGQWPTDYSTSVIISIPKKVNADECKFYRTISIIPHASKIMLKILHGRMTKKIDEFLSDSQFGFRSERGTRDATGTLRQFIERRLEVGKKYLHMLHRF